MITAMPRLCASCDLELLRDRAFSPLRGFVGRADYECVCNSMLLAHGLLWPIPVTLDVTNEFMRKIGTGAAVTLRDPEGAILAALPVQEVWQPDRNA